MGLGGAVQFRACFACSLHISKSLSTFRCKTQNVWLFFFPLPFLLFFHFVCLFAFAPSNALCFVPMFSLADQRWVPRGWLWTLLGSKMKNTGCRGEVASLNGLIPTKARCDSHWRLAWRGQPLPWGARE